MEKLLAAGGVVGALATSSCCALPLALAAAGIGGTWMGALASLAPYQPLFLGVAALCIGSGLWKVYGRAQVACEGSNCSQPGAQRITRVALWLAAALLLVGGSAEWWARLL